MQKIWGYITAVLGGALLMLIIAYKWLAGDDYTVEIKKIKVKKNEGDVSMPIDVDQDGADPGKSRKELRKEKRQKRKES